MGCFDEVHEAALAAIMELDQLCERYDVSYIHYSLVADSILAICERAIPKGEHSAGQDEGEGGACEARYDAGRSRAEDGSFPLPCYEDSIEGHGREGEHAEEDMPRDRVPCGGHLVIVL